MSGLSTVALVAAARLTPQYPDPHRQDRAGRHSTRSPPGAMTASPFTSNSLAGVQDGRAKYIVLAALLGLSVAGL